MKPDPLFDGFDPQIINAHGPIGSGKTFLAGTASQFWPGDISGRTAGKGKKATLEDVYWGVVDSDATAGFSVIGIDVPNYNFQRVMGTEKGWKEAGFSRKPSIVEAAARFTKMVAERVAKGQTRIVVVDTITGLDGAFIAHNRKIVDADEKLRSNQYALWQLNLATNQTFHDALKFSGVPVLIYLSHTKPADEGTPHAAKKNMMVLTAGGARFVPAITGQSAAVYKRDETMQLVCIVKRDPGKKGTDALKRSIITDVETEGYESKQRYGGILPLIMEPDLRKAYDLIRKAQRRWK